MELVINDDNLEIDEVKDFCTKVRAILIDENNNILVANYGNVFLLPGGKVNEGETISEAIARELSEELGQDYGTNELDFFVTLNYYQKDYPKRDGTFQNRLVKTHYFAGLYKGIKKDFQKLTEKEQKDKFRLELVSFEDLENMIMNNRNNNPRNVYFQRESLTILASFKNIIKCKHNKREGLSKPVKVIFLDFNGVLDTYENMDQINEENLKRLKYIVDTTQAKIVISSSLKNSYYYTGHFSEHLQNIIQELEKIGIEVIGITPYVGEREEEIKLYLKQHPEIDEYCILDDDYEMKDLKENLVKLPSQMQVGQAGLEDVHVNMAINILTRKK